MSVQIVQAKIKRESVTDAQAAAKKLFAALSDAQPEEIHCVSYLLPNGETFVALTQLDASLRSLYAEDLRRAFSPERDVGLHWALA